MSPAFPVRHIDKTDPRYHGLPQYVFMLQPPLQGAPAHEFVRFAEDLKSGIEAKSLADSGSIPHFPRNGQYLTLQLLKDEVSGIISNNPLEWVRGCVGISLMHRPESHDKLVSLMAKLPESTDAPPGQKLLSIPHAGEVFAFKVKLHENRFLPEGSLVIWLDNPAEPAAEHLVQSGSDESLTLTELFASKENAEYFAMASLGRDLLADENLTHDDLECRYEPLGNAFPDFELVVRGQQWAVEVTRIEHEMVSHLRLAERMGADMLDRVVQRQVTRTAVAAALHKALTDKTRIRTQCTQYPRACLLLLDVVDAVDAADSSIWDGIDLSAFDAIALVKLDGTISYIKNSAKEDDEASEG